MAARPVRGAIPGSAHPHRAPLHTVIADYLPTENPLAGAACVGEDTDLFFASAPRAVDAAKRICAHCPVRVACLRQAMANGEMYGVFGGLTADERHTLRRRLSRMGVKAA
ncbi:WhiB family transcriptional regulator [Streptomyces sp. cg36]|uniref:WhiB family transcriptional regulator n=1 Tax=Streptomyces sp. cg36 TaxID=3238798 RepID=UPI0034E2F918